MRIALACISFLILASPAWGQTFLPPEEFDHPYKGRTVIQIARDQDHVREICKAVFNTGQAPGCAKVIVDICLIVKVPDSQIRAMGIVPELFMRHETGHCNGWPATHKGAR